MLIVLMMIGGIAGSIFLGGVVMSAVQASDVSHRLMLNATI